MDNMDIIYYTRNDEGKGKTISLRELNLREEIALEAIFYAVRDAVDEQDLLDQLRRLIWDEVIPDRTCPTYFSFRIIDMCGNISYLKFKKKKEK